MEKQDEKQNDGVIYFQDYFSNIASRPTDEVAIGEAFFELANAPIVGYRIERTPSRRKLEVRVKQEGDCQTHTGGIVWETAYLLARYLKLNSGGDKSLGKVLEVGSGCGMLGLILSASKLAKHVTMTETTDVLPNLEQNLAYNLKCNRKNEESYGHACCSLEEISTRKLRWDKFEKDIRKCQAEHSSDLDPHSFDTIVGTDVIFSKSLVKPLLRTLKRMSHDKTQIYLCVQIRCSDSHAIFLKSSSKYGFIIKDCTDELKSFDDLQWGLQMECKLLTLIKDSNESKKKRKREMKKINGTKRGKS